MPIYRNVTLAGVVRSASGVGSTEVDLRLRRNAFDLTAQPPAGAAADQPLAGRTPPVLTLSDLTMVNLPQGPPSTWPMGLFTGSLYSFKRLRYMNAWYVRLTSLLPEEVASAEWLRRLVQPNTMFSGVLRWNHTATAKVLLTAPTSPPAYALWSLPSGALLPPASFAVARNASELGGLLQQPWADGPRVILMTGNAGPRLAYNVALVGPASGPPVWLDAGGLPLAQGPATAPGAAGWDGAQAGLALALARLRLAGLAAPLLSEGLVNGSAVSLVGGSAGLDAWRTRCTAHLDTLPSAAPVSYSLNGSVVELPAGPLLLLAALADRSVVCASAAAVAVWASPSALAAACGLATADKGLSQALPAAVASLLGSMLTVQGQALVTGSPLAFVLVASGSLGGTSLTNVTFALAPGGPPDMNGTACDAASLISAAWGALQAAATGTGRSAPSAGVVGGAVGGAVGATCLVAALAALGVALHHRRRSRGGQEKGAGSVPSEDLEAAGNGGSGGAGVAADGAAAAESRRNARS
ncbi:hypothetical protein HYH03_014526 [Edaphochlamys debaryana]|uniref:Uncharacterized protein n=1 Tax=Edaphochlamys debaryana TaxID=47281 RepID=A0A835XMK4_9CHLO|nr:hypothetical protein HYH03_014526 [Edaphochlamys debaryana]|eukprot:KAG2486843.1 hypothetical protein HYH03_014526 [Edaphochlamys debaryana]